MRPVALSESSSGFLDEQFAQLMLRLCEQEHYVLSELQKTQLYELARATSQATRQNSIANRLPSTLSADELTELLKTPALGKAGDYKPLITEYGYIWLNRYWQYEQRLAKNLVARLYAIDLSAANTHEIDKTVNQWFSHPDTALQKQAVAQAAKHPFLIISGGPGTGKTTTLTRLLCLLIGQLGIKPQRIRLAAPTGKAAMRMQEAIRQAKQTLKLEPELAAHIPEQASTLHRLLGFLPKQVGFRHHAGHPLPADVVIVDEASMIDISLMTHLCESVSPQTRLILLGDKDQLASVETGSIFRDLCLQEPNNPHPLDPYRVVLEKSWRFSSESGIGRLATAVRDRQENALLELLQQQPTGVTWSELARLDSKTLQTAWKPYLSQVQQWQTNPDPALLSSLFQAFNQFRVLTPLRKGSLGTERLNISLGKLLAPALPRIQQGAWYAGRPVMVIENDYRQGLFNGDIGISLPSAEGLKVWFANTNTGGFRAIAPVRLPAHETAWAMTIHKSQGSEFERVLLLLPEQDDSQMLVRELLYTGITRAKQQIDIMGRQSVLLAALKRDLPTSSCIRRRLRDLYHASIQSEGSTL
ncbi:exodeoxyribonuclease V subunit alpha [Thiolinea disciformis]|uniref:exodeoxyribonuclease V subunit alpha n=1 Tax=Thiolinea disciformis TaxID=125614 RepID=UPI00036CFEED|nr:exodeoxyribonuclease V subunit alpha [Thiolinea disciformis]